MLITKGDGEVVMVTAAFVSLLFGVVFTYVLRREVKLPHGEGVRAWKLVSFPWARSDHARRWPRPRQGQRGVEREGPSGRDQGQGRAEDPGIAAQIGSAAMDFTYGDRLDDLLRRVRSFMDEHVYPVEAEGMAALDDEVSRGSPTPRSSSASARKA